MLQLITPPAGNLPKTYLQDLRSHCGYITDSEDNRLKAYAATAIAYLEKATSRSFESTTWREVYSSFPTKFTLLRSPVSSITHVKYYDGSNVLTTFTDYTLLNPSFQPCKICPNSYPSTYDRADAVEIQYVTAWSPLPAQFLHCLRLLVAHWDSNREAVLTGTVSKEIEFGLTNLLNQLKVKV